MKSEIIQGDFKRSFYAELWTEDYQNPLMREGYQKGKGITYFLLLN